METPPRRVLRFAGVAVGVLVALLLVPATRWIVQMQTAMQLSPFVIQSTTLGGLGVRDLPVNVSPGSLEMANRAMAAAAARRPQDYERQLVAARIKGQNGWGEATIDPRKGGQQVAYYLRKLRPQFGDRPGLYAHILRYATQGEVRV